VGDTEDIYTLLDDRYAFKILGNLLHMHECECGTMYVHYHLKGKSRSNKHEQFLQQCPNKDCVRISKQTGKKESNPPHPNNRSNTGSISVSDLIRHKNQLLEMDPEYDPGNRNMESLLGVQYPLKDEEDHQNDNLDEEEVVTTKTKKELVREEKFEQFKNKDQDFVLHLDGEGAKLDEEQMEEHVLAQSELDNASKKSNEEVQFKSTNKGTEGGKMFKEYKVHNVAFEKNIKNAFPELNISLDTDKAGNLKKKSHPHKEGADARSLFESFLMTMCQLYTIVNIGGNFGRLAQKGFKCHSLNKIMDEDSEDPLRAEKYAIEHKRYKSKVTYCFCGADINLGGVQCKYCNSVRNAKMVTVVSNDTCYYPGVIDYAIGLAKNKQLYRFYGSCHIFPNSNNKWRNTMYNTARFKTDSENVLFAVSGNSFTYKHKHPKIGERFLTLENYKEIHYIKISEDLSLVMNVITECDMTNHKYIAFELIPYKNVPEYTFNSIVSEEEKNNSVDIPNVRTIILNKSNRERISDTVFSEMLDFASPKVYQIEDAANTNSRTTFIFDNHTLYAWRINKKQSFIREDLTLYKDQARIVLPIDVVSKMYEGEAWLTSSSKIFNQSKALVRKGTVADPLLAADIAIILSEIFSRIKLSIATSVEKNPILKICTNDDSITRLATESNVSNTIEKLGETISSIQTVVSDISNSKTLIDAFMLDDITPSYHTTSTHKFLNFFLYIFYKLFSETEVNNWESYYYYKDINTMVIDHVVKIVDKHTSNWSGKLLNYLKYTNLGFNKMVKVFFLEMCGLNYCWKIISAYSKFKNFIQNWLIISILALIIIKTLLSFTFLSVYLLHMEVLEFLTANINKAIPVGVLLLSLIVIILFILPNSNLNFLTISIGFSYLILCTMSLLILLIGNKNYKNLSIAILYVYLFLFSGRWRMYVLIIALADVMFVVNSHPLTIAANCSPNDIATFMDSIIVFLEFNKMRVKFEKTNKVDLETYRPECDYVYNNDYLLQKGPIFKGVNTNNFPTKLHQCEKTIWEAIGNQMSCTVSPSVKSLDMLDVVVDQYLYQLDEWDDGNFISLESWLNSYSGLQKTEYEEAWASYQDLPDIKHRKKKMHVKVDEKIFINRNFGEKMVSGTVNKYSYIQKSRNVTAQNPLTKLIMGYMVQKIYSIQKKDEGFGSGLTHEDRCVKFQKWKNRLSKPVILCCDGSKFDSTQHIDIIKRVDKKKFEHFYNKYQHIMLQYFTEDDIINVLTDFVHEVMAVSKNKSKFDKVIRYTMEGTQITGGMNTSLDNTTRSLMYMRLIASQLDMVEGVDYFIEAAGDDTILFMEEEYQNRFINKAYEIVYTPDPLYVGEYGLGQIAKQFDISSEVTGVEYLSCYLLENERGEICMIRKPERLLQLLGWTYNNKFTNPVKRDKLNKEMLMCEAINLGLWNHDILLFNSISRLFKRVSKTVKISDKDLDKHKKPADLRNLKFDHIFVDFLDAKYQINYHMYKDFCKGLDNVNDLYAVYEHEMVDYVTKVHDINSEIAVQELLGTVRNELHLHGKQYELVHNVLGMS